MQTAGTVVSLGSWTAGRREIVKKKSYSWSRRREGWAQEQAGPCANLAGM